MASFKITPLLESSLICIELLEEEKKKLSCLLSQKGMSKGPFPPSSLPQGAKAEQLVGHLLCEIPDCS